MYSVNHFYRNHAFIGEVKKLYFNAMYQKTLKKLNLKKKECFVTPGQDITVVSCIFQVSFTLNVRKIFLHVSLEDASFGIL